MSLVRLLNERRRTTYAVILGVWMIVAISVPMLVTQTIQISSYAAGALLSGALLLLIVRMRCRRAHET